MFEPCVCPTCGNVYSYSVGFFVTLPEDICVVGLDLPYESVIFGDPISQSVQVFKLLGPPPPYPPATTDYESIFYAQNKPFGSTIRTGGINFEQGDVLAVLGQFLTPPPSPPEDRLVQGLTTCFGEPTTVTIAGTDADLFGLQSFSTVGDGPITTEIFYNEEGQGRVQVYYTEGCCNGCGK